MAESQSKKDEKREEIHMAVMTKPSSQPFIVSARKARKFSDKRMKKEKWEEISQMSKKFDDNNLHMKDR